MQSVSGFGFALFSVPLLAVLAGPQEAVAIAAVLGTLTTARQLALFRRAIHWRLAARLSGAACFGMPVGLVILLVLDADLLRILIAVSVVVFAIAVWRGVTFSNDAWGVDVVAGFISGVLNTSVGTNGPPLVLSLQGRGLEPDPFRGTIAVVFAVTNVVTVVLLAWKGKITAEVLVLSTVGIPALVAGMVVGRRLQRRLDPAHFRKWVLVLLFASAAVAVVTSILSLNSR